MKKNAQGHEVIMLSLYAMVRAIVVEKWKSSAWPRKVKIRLDSVLLWRTKTGYPSSRCSHADTVCDATLYISGISLSARPWTNADASA